MLFSFASSALFRIDVAGFYLEILLSIIWYFNSNIWSLYSFCLWYTLMIVLTAYDGVGADLQSLSAAIIARKLRAKDHTTASGLLFVFLS